MSIKDDVREFLTSRRAKVTPEQAGLPTFGGKRRVTGLRREEVALLAGVSANYYTRLERGNLAGVSEQCSIRSPGHYASTTRSEPTCSTSPGPRPARSAVHAVRRCRRCAPAYC